MDINLYNDLVRDMKDAKQALDYAEWESVNALKWLENRRHHYEETKKAVDNFNKK